MLEALEKCKIPIMNNSNVEQLNYFSFDENDINNIISIMQALIAYGYCYLKYTHN